VTQNTEWNSYYSFNAPAKSGVYNIMYRRAKSREVTTGTARYRKRDKGWAEITNARTQRPVDETYDSRDNRIVSPVVVAWR